MFHSFLCDNIKQDADMIAAHKKRIIDLFKIYKKLGFGVSTIWYNTYGCANNYRCDTALFLLSTLSQYYDIVIYRGIIARGHVREFLDGLNDKNKRSIFQLATTVKLPGSKRFDIQM